MAAQPKKRKSKSVSALPRLVVPPEMAMSYCDQFILTSTAQGEMVLSFFQTQHPVAAPAPGEQVDTICKARIICNFQFAANLVTAIQNTFRDRGLLPPSSPPSE